MNSNSHHHQVMVASYVFSRESCLPYGCQLLIRSASSPRCGQSDSGRFVKTEGVFVMNTLLLIILVRIYVAVCLGSFGYISICRSRVPFEIIFDVIFSRKTFVKLKKDSKIIQSQ